MIQSLNERFAMEGLANFEAGEGGLPKLCLSTLGGASAEIYLHGAHVTSFRPPQGTELLWMSRASDFAKDRPIRGGIPICWPWFGKPAERDDLPQHGFARTSAWQVEAVSQNEGSAEAELSATLSLQHNEDSLSLWPHEFDLQYQVSVGNQLSVELRFTNNSDQPASVGTAIHTYFDVANIESVQVSGLDGRRYVDQLDASSSDLKLTEGEITFGEEVDRIYVDSEDEVTIRDAVLNKRILVSKSGSRSTVVWNPWIAKSQRMADFPDDGYQTMLCVETTNAADDVRRVMPGETHVLSQTCRVDL